MTKLSITRAPAHKRGLYSSLQWQKAISQLGRAMASKLSLDAGKVEAILQNLVVNAFKYTTEGEVKIRMKNPNLSATIKEQNGPHHQRKGN